MALSLCENAKQNYLPEKFIHKKKYITDVRGHDKNT